MLGLERFDLPGVAAGLVAGLALQGVAIAIDVFILDPLFDLDDGSQLVEAFQGGFEITLLVHSFEFAGDIENMLEADMKRSHPVSLQDFDNRPVWFPLAMGCARLLAPVL